MMKEKISGVMSTLPDRFIEEAMEVQPTRSGHHRQILRRMTAIAAALVMLVGVGVPALAASNEAFNAALYRVFPGLAQAMKPVQLSCEDNGIRMEVLSASVEDGTARVYLSLQDMTCDRIDETVDLFDSFHMNLPADLMTGHCEQIAYDPDAKAATFLCTLEGWDAAKLSNKVTFSLHCFISGKKTVTCDVLTFVPADLPEGALWEGVTLRGYGSSDGTKLTEMLLPQAQPLAEPADGVQVTGLAYVNGILHVQHHYDDIKYLDIHGFPTLIASDGTMVEDPTSTNASAFDASKIGSYEDDTFSIPQTDTRPYTLRGEYTIATQYTEGHWQVTFPIGE